MSPSGHPLCGFQIAENGDCRLCDGDARSECCSAAVVVHSFGVFDCYGCGSATTPRLRKLGETKLRARFAGTCVTCGCTDERACPGGCRWADEEETICTTCGL